VLVGALDAGNVPTMGDAEKRWKSKICGGAYNLAWRTSRRFVMHWHGG
jgi:hypothetical protein